MNFKDKIKDLKPYDLNCNVFDVYSYNGLSMQELLCQFFHKINDCIKISNDTIDLASWLVNEGLSMEVVNKLMLWLEDGTLENIINVNLFNSLNTKIDNLNSQLAIETRTKRLQGENTKNDIKGTFDSANFAGQDLGKDAPIGNVMHHYTDGICFQIDNVGEDNKILILKNAYNPGRRPDKSEDFVGTGDFLSCLTGVIGELSRNVFIINRDGNIIYKDKLTTAEFINNKPSDSNVAFRFDIYNKHTKLFEIKNGMNWDFSISNASDKCVIQNGNGTQNGLKIESILGGIDISSANNISLVTQNNTGSVYVHGKIKELLNGTYTEVQPIYSGTSGARPTTDLIPGYMFFDKTLNKPIWRNKDNNGWVDAMGTSV